MYKDTLQLLDADQVAVFLMGVCGLHHEGVKPATQKRSEEARLTQWHKLLVSIVQQAVSLHKKEWVATQFSMSPRPGTLMLPSPFETCPDYYK